MALVNTKLSFPITLGYVGKISGSTAENPNIAKTIASASLSAPSAFINEFNNGDYSNISTLNSVVNTLSNTTNTFMRQALFSFDLITSVERQLGIVIGFNTASKVAWLKANITSVVCDWYGFGSSPTGSKATLSWWGGSNYQSPATHSNSVVTKLSRTIAASLSSAIDSNGFVHYIAYSDPSNGTVASTINTDYVELIVTTSFEINTRTDWAITDAINYDDWNRIETNMNEVSTFLNAIQYANTAPTVVTNRTNISIDYLSSINRIENNLEALRVAFITPADYLPKKTWTVGKGFDYADANRLEKNTKSLLDWGMLVYQSYRYCGTFYCGQGWGLG